MAEILCTLPLPEPFPSLTAQRASTRVLGRIPAPEELAATLGDHPVDVLCPQLRDPITATLLDSGLPRLRCVALYAVGYNNVDVDAATARGVVVTNTPGVLTDATADLAMGLLLAAARRICEGDREMRAGRFTGWTPDYLLGLELTGALLGIVGFGRIGQAVARRALAFGMRVIYSTDVPVSLDDDLAGRVEEVPVEELFATADAVSLHVPLTESTHHLVDGAMLGRMRSTAVLVNTSRGPVVDEAALVTALREGGIFAAGLDVYENEPDVAPGLRDCPNVVLAPHLGSATVATRAAMARLTAENALAALDGRMPPNCINPEAWRDQSPPPVA